MIQTSAENPSFDARAMELFRAMVESVGVKRFAAAMDLSTRQVNRMLAGAQPNPVERMLRCVQASSPETGDAAIDAICQELGGYFVRYTADAKAATDLAVREAAEAIAAISDGHVSSHDEQEIREAISALISLLPRHGTERRAPTR
jgi:dihydropteroate synthase